jgi:tocopherol O-methyltransferase
MMTPISSAAIRSHYDRLSVFYRWLWGEHIHHGLWRNGESPQQAQVELVKELAARMGIARGAELLDVGCGLGGSAIWLAQQLNCKVTGITISPVQKRMAEKRAQSLELDHRVQFRVADANQLEFAPRSFDAIWVIECAEHLFDRAAFVRKCAELLRECGRIGICAWLAEEEPRTSRNSVLLETICSGMLCPPLPSFGHYQRWFRESGFQQIEAEDITGNVMQTWQICERIMAIPAVRVCLPLLGRQTREFAAQVGAMKRAFATGALQYGVFTARKK